MIRCILKKKKAQTHQTIVCEPFWVAITDAWKLQWRGLDFVSGGNLGAILPMTIREVWWGAGVLESVDTWE